jgi:hypothetical protein
LLFFAANSFSQKITTSIDSSQIKIGSQFNLTLKASVNANDKVVFPDGKYFGALEILESYPVDTIKNNSQYELIKKYGLTQFDSGRYLIPKLLVKINQKAFRTDTLSVLVNNVKVDTTKQQMFDIKNIIATEEKPSSEWWKWLILLALIIASGFGSYFIVKKLQKSQIKEEEFFASPIEKAIAYLQNLDKKQLIQKGEVKEYYSEMTDIARTYIEESVNVVGFCNKVPFTISISLVAWRTRFKVEVIGADAYSIIDGRGRSEGPQVHTFGKRWGWINSTSQKDSETTQLLSQYDNSILDETKSWLTDKSNLATSLDGLKSMQLYDLIAKKLETRGSF